MGVARNSICHIVMGVHGIVQVAMELWRSFLKLSLGHNSGFMTNRYLKNSTTSFFMDVSQYSEMLQIKSRNDCSSF